MQRSHVPGCYLYTKILIFIYAGYKVRLKASTSHYMGSGNMYTPVLV